MRVAGFKFGPDHGSNHVLMETPIGAFIYHSDAASFHAWDLRV